MGMNMPALERWKEKKLWNSSSWRSQRFITLLLFIPTSERARKTNPPITSLWTAKDKLVTCKSLFSPNSYSFFLAQSTTRENPIKDIITVCSHRNRIYFSEFRMRLWKANNKDKEEGTYPNLNADVSIPNAPTKIDIFPLS